jgi:hypothetical protein
MGRGVPFGSVQAATHRLVTAANGIGVNGTIRVAFGAVRLVLKGEGEKTYGYLCR